MTAEGIRDVKTVRLIPIITLGCALLAAPGISPPAFGQAPQPAQPSSTGTTVVWTTEMRATVESIDHTTRHVVLRGPEGNRVALTARPQVRNLEQVRAGDQVVIRYTEALAASLARPDDRSGANVTRQEGMVRSEPGQRPGGVIGGQVPATVQVEAIRAVFPEAVVQTCIVHLLRHSLDFVSWKDRKPVAAALKDIYRAVDPATA